MLVDALFISVAKGCEPLWRIEKVIFFQQEDLSPHAIFKALLCNESIFFN